MKCKVCGKEFELKKENRYTTLNCNISILFNRNKQEAFDCPHCGCQNVVNERYCEIGEDEAIVLDEPHGTE